MRKHMIDVACRSIKSGTLYMYCAASPMPGHHALCHLTWTES